MVTDIDSARNKIGSYDELDVFKVPSDYSQALDDLGNFLQLRSIEIVLEGRELEGKQAATGRETYH